MGNGIHVRPQRIVSASLEPIRVNRALCAATCRANVAQTVFGTLAYAWGRAPARQARMSRLRAESAESNCGCAAVTVFGAIGVSALVKALARLERLERRPAVIVVPRQEAVTVTAPGAHTAAVRKAPAVLPDSKMKRPAVNAVPRSRCVILSASGGPQGSARVKACAQREPRKHSPAETAALRREPVVPVVRGGVGVVARTPDLVALAR